jgi:hypothetical protein
MVDKRNRSKKRGRWEVYWRLTWGEVAVDGLSPAKKAYSIVRDALNPRNPSTGVEASVSQIWCKQCITRDTFK